MQEFKESLRSRPSAAGTRCRPSAGVHQEHGYPWKSLFPDGITALHPDNRPAKPAALRRGGPRSCPCIRIVVK